MQRWIASLQQQNQSASQRNRWLAGLFGLGLLLLLFLLGWLYQSGVRSYAVLDQVTVQQHPASQGRVEVAFQVVRPGRVFLSRRSGAITTEVIDYFTETGPQQRSWSWVYEPGQEIDVAVRYRGAFWRKSQQATFGTSSKADIVILIDTTGSMNRMIATLRDKCVQFSQAMQKQKIEHRFALVGFGDASEDDWCDLYDFTTDVDQFRTSVEKMKRYDGGDLPESSLDALEKALSLPLADGAMRRFYLVTDAQFHAPSRAGTTVEALARLLLEKNVLLQVFTQDEFRGDYLPLAGAAGKVQSMEDFGQVLSEGRILED